MSKVILTPCRLIQDIKPDDCGGHILRQAWLITGYVIFLNMEELVDQRPAK